jgi:hypothetical protein
MEVRVSGGGLTPISSCDSYRLHQVARTFVLRYQGLLMKTGNRISASQSIESQMNEYAREFSLTEKEQLTAEYSRLGRPEVLGTFSTATLLKDGMIAVKQDAIV